MMIPRPQPSRINSATVPVLSVVVALEPQKQTAVYAGFFALSSSLPAPYHPSYKSGPIYGFVAYRATVTTVSIHASYCFSVSPQSWQPKNPVRALVERTREHPAGAVLFGETTTYRLTTVSMLYFGYVCRQASARSRGVAPRLNPMPAQAPRQVAAGNAAAVPQAVKLPATAPVPAPAPERPGATVSLRPVEQPKTSDPFDWEKRPFDEMRHRYEVWNALGQKKPPRVEVSLKASPTVSKTVTPRNIDEKGLSFSAVNADGTPEEIPFGDVSRLRVLSA